MLTHHSYVCSPQLCLFTTAMLTHHSYVCSYVNHKYVNHSYVNHMLAQLCNACTVMQCLQLCNACSYAMLAVMQCYTCAALYIIKSYLCYLVHCNSILVPPCTLQQHMCASLYIVIAYLCCLVHCNSILVLCLTRLWLCLTRL